MRPGSFVILFLVTFVSCSIIASADSIPNGMHSGDSASIQRQLRSSETTVKADEEERGFGVSGLKKLNNLIRGNTKSGVALEKNSAVMKELNGLKNNPVLVKGLKSVNENPVVMKRIDTLKKMDPKAVESLRKAPVEKSVKQVHSYLSKGQSSRLSSEAKAAIWLICLVLGVAGMITIVSVR